MGPRLCGYAASLPKKPYPTFLRLADYLLRYGSFTNELRLRPNDCYYIARRARKEITEILGFEDQATFSRFFKKMTGESAP